MITYKMCIVLGTLKGGRADWLIEKCTVSDLLLVCQLSESLVNVVPLKFAYLRNSERVVSHHF